MAHFNKESETRQVLMKELLQDLQSDAGDIAQFMDNSAQRVTASIILTTTDTSSSRVRVNMIRLLGFSSILEIIESTFQEMTSSGTFSAIEDMELRIMILSYYGLAKDRLDINDLLLPQMLRFRAALEELGYPYRGGNDIPLEVIQNPKIKALITVLGAEASDVSWYVKPLLNANTKLIEKLSASLSEP